MGICWGCRECHQLQKHRDGIDPRKHKGWGDGSGSWASEKGFQHCEGREDSSKNARLAKQATQFLPKFIKTPKALFPGETDEQNASAQRGLLKHDLFTHNSQSSPNGEEVAKS